MKPVIYDMEQRSDEWFAVRCGKLTASRVADATARTRSGWGAARERYLTEVVLERITGQVVPLGFTTADMQWGTDTEPDARAAYEFRVDVAVEEVGFVDHATIENFGCSPDGFVGDDGLVEIKCPASHTHLKTILADKIPPQYIKQMQAQMMICQREWCDFVSFDPRMPPHLTYWSKRLHLSDDLKELSDDVQEFLKNVDGMVESLNEKR